jgi:Tfp pilus tip-associated adhesin PilY1
MPLFQARHDNGVIQPITAKPDVMRPCDPTLTGYFVIFGTGKYLGEQDFSSISRQTLYGLYDYGDDVDDSEYLGFFDRGNVPALSNQPDTVGLQAQTLIATVTQFGRQLRILSDEPVEYIVEDDPDDPTYQMPDPSSTEANVIGWYFDLPERKERMVRDVTIRSGKAIIITNLPNKSPCSAGGESYLMEVDACTGGRLTTPQFDINNDNRVDSADMVQVQNPNWNEGDPPEDQFIEVAPSAIWFPTMIYTPSILSAEDEEIKLMSTAGGSIIDLWEAGERKGIFYWQQIGD